MTLEGVILKLDPPHDAPESPAANVVVLGKYSLSNTRYPLEFAVHFFDGSEDSYSIEVTASRKNEGLSHVFDVSSKTPSVRLDIK